VNGANKASQGSEAMRVRLDLRAQRDLKAQPVHAVIMVNHESHENGEIVSRRSKPCESSVGLHQDRYGRLRELANSESLSKDGAKLVTVRVDTKPAEAIP